MAYYYNFISNMFIKVLPMVIEVKHIGSKYKLNIDPCNPHVAQTVNLSVALIVTQFSLPSKLFNVESESKTSVILPSITTNNQVCDIMAKVFCNLMTHPHQTDSAN